MYTIEIDKARYNSEKNIIELSSIPKFRTIARNNFRVVILPSNETINIEKFGLNTSDLQIGDISDYRKEETRYKRVWDGINKNSKTFDDLAIPRK